jgi:hypothetical protein
MATTSSSVQIIPYYAHPHTHVVINDKTQYDETVAVAQDPDNLPFATCVVTGADSGIDNTFVRLNSKKTKQALFGKGNFPKYGQASLQADVLFNGSTNVWLCRVLPDNATYANMIVLVHYRLGKILDDLNQETGKVRMEVKFSLAYASKPKLTDGAKTDFDIEEYARSLASETVDPLTGYMTVPLYYVRSTGRGQYGNVYSMAMSRDNDAEKEYSLKMYKFNLLSNSVTTKLTNVFSGSLFQNIRYDMSTLVSDVIDQFPTGSAPVKIVPFEDSFATLYNFYKEKIVATNAAYLAGSNATTADLTELSVANAIIEDTFDPMFGMILNTRIGEKIPYYRNYTVTSNGLWTTPDLTIPNTLGSAKPLNTADWNTAYVGAKVLVVADPLNDGHRWIYTVMHIDAANGNIVYDEGVESAIDADQYDGVDLTRPVGHMFSGGHDGDFQEITVNGKTRPPSAAEMKILLSREFVKAFRGEKDRKILSPARVNLDFMYDANYNMTSDEGISIDTSSVPLFNGSTILTDKDAQQLAILGTSTMAIDFSDLNVKKAMYDLNEFRNCNGMTINLEQGAGCSLYLDCNLTGLKNIGINYELVDIINMMEEFDGRATSIDLGYYEIYDPVSRKRIKVTTTYFIAQYLIPHIMSKGLNKPFVSTHAQLSALQRDNSLVVSGNMIRDSFRPDIDLIDWDVKELLYKSRINYYLTTDEGRVVQRAVQNTRQREASALLEENNVRVLNMLKKGLEKACRGYSYEWNEPEVRKGYTEAQTEVYRPWIGTMVKDLRIEFQANEFEQERMIMHCYAEVEFRDITKRIILEINIQRPNYSGGEA